MTARDREIDAIAAILAGSGILERPQLARLAHAELWGPGRFSAALREAVARNRVRRTGPGQYALGPAAPRPGDAQPPADPPATAAEPERSGEPGITIFFGRSRPVHDVSGVIS